jgi:hypothetical protein
MKEEKMEKLKDLNYEVDDISKFLNLTPEEAERITEMILKARLEWIMER